jgi:hypothetical protein
MESCNSLLNYELNLFKLDKELDLNRVIEKEKEFKKKVLELKNEYENLDNSYLGEINKKGKILKNL